MASKTGISKFKFVSPGIQVAEIDNSQLPRLPTAMGPVIIGRAERGTGLRPVTVNSYSEFVEIFGEPESGGDGNEVWRRGNNLAPTYGAYAAQAYLRNSSPVTFVRLLGAHHTNATSDGKAGWQVGSAHAAGYAGGAFGLWVINSASEGVAQTGCLAAVFYAKTGSIELSGAQRNAAASATHLSGTHILFASENGTTANEFSVIVKGASDGADISERLTFNFDRTSKMYIRKVCNTNPTLLNTNITDTAKQKTYFLGESFEGMVEDHITGSTAQQYGFITALYSGSIDQNHQRMSMQKASTGWVISQDLGSPSNYSPIDQEQLFRFKSIDGGSWESKNLKISISDVRASTTQTSDYGSFNVEVRLASDNDNSPIRVETFSQCNLNPNSPNYIARKIGDRFVEWDDQERRYREYGNYSNQSRYIYVEVAADVDNGTTNATMLPFGYLGPIRWRGFGWTSGGAGVAAAVSVRHTPMKFTTAVNYGAADFLHIDNDSTAFIAEGGGSANEGTVNSAQHGNFLDVGAANAQFTGSFVFPRTRLRTNASDGDLANPRDAYFGLNTNRKNSIVFDDSYQDVIRAFPDNFSPNTSTTDQAGITSFSSSHEYSYIFSLDDVSGSHETGAGTGQKTNAKYVSGSRKAGNSLTSGSYTTVLNRGFNKFTMPLIGGFDGLDITEMDPFNNTRGLEDGSGTSLTPETGYAFNSVKRAADSCADPEVVECNMMTAPGVTNTTLTEHILSVCEKRGDSLAIIDLKSDYVPPSENNNGDSAVGNRGDVDNAVDSLNSRALNSSYGAAYYPWVQTRDRSSGVNVWIPPSVAAIGTYASSEAQSDLWFAPAGFTRGGLTDGAAGIPITGVKQRLRQKDRDKLYEANINPIATFPAEGIVIFGQKTLQRTPSALDRVNVRRLLIFVKKEISRMAATVLFDQNVQTTWDRFTGQVVPFLNSVKSRLGLEDFRVILDSSTTTPDLVDRNVMYAKIFLKPARAIEFIAIDFVITNTGASFSD